ncbi:hypothetical protein U27_03095 [Candidatus Vecturithrix granuli]|uniref:Uncharacterized protein n=1 Tax=Vecturithrix granuli TaxID=1499967 RepID=A0A081BUX8_VECG1|nr:hypothetical protein U27_03095 [Candidatus Vecturithrix granuli]
MLDKILLYIGAALPLFWGIAHLFPTNSVVKGFGNISLNNKRIITMEWIIEGVALIFIGVVIAAVTYIDDTSVVSKVVYTISFMFLNILSVISLMTGSKIDFIPFKLCPIIFTSASIMVLLGNYL